MLVYLVPSTAVLHNNNRSIAAPVRPPGTIPPQRLCQLLPPLGDVRLVVVVARYREATVRQAHDDPAHRFWTQMHRQASPQLQHDS